jgi:hypothetical protein
MRGLVATVMNGNREEKTAKERAQVGGGKNDWSGGKISFPPDRALKNFYLLLLPSTRGFFSFLFALATDHEAQSRQGERNNVREKSRGSPQEGTERMHSQVAASWANKQLEESQQWTTQKPSRGLWESMAQSPRDWPT